MDALLCRIKTVETSCLLFDCRWKVCCL